MTVTAVPGDDFSQFVAEGIVRHDESIDDLTALVTELARSTEVIASWAGGINRILASLPDEFRRQGEAVINESARVAIEATRGIAARTAAAVAAQEMDKSSFEQHIERDGNGRIGRVVLRRVATP